MSTSGKILYNEQQYHGLNKHSMIRRLLLSVFCFVAYYWSENPKPVDVALIHIGEYPGNVKYGELFFVLGLALLALSVILHFVLHMKTSITAKEITLHAVFPSRTVRIPLAEIKSFRRVTVRPTIFARPVFNLPVRGKQRFYTSGSEFIEIVNKSGKTFRIGTQKGSEMCQVLQNAVS